MWFSLGRRQGWWVEGESCESFYNILMEKRAAPNCKFFLAVRGEVGETGGTNLPTSIFRPSLTLRPGSRPIEAR